MGTEVESDEPESRVLGRTDGQEAEPITRTVILVAVVGGLAGVVAMTPLLVGIPQLLGVFRADPIIDFVALGSVVGVEPNLVLGALVFAFAGTVVLPLLFVVAGAFLPPRGPENWRGITFATIMWTGFVLAFWPGGGIRTVGPFVAFSLLAHWVYGYVLGTTLDRFVGIPQHAV